MPSMDTAPALHMNIRSEFHSFTVHLLGGDVNVRFYRLPATFFARLDGMDWWNHITLRKHLIEGLKDEESSNCEKYACIKNKNLLCLLFSWRDGSIFVSISLEIHSSQVWSESICFSNVFTPQTKPVTRTSKQQHTHKAHNARFLGTTTTARIFHTTIANCKKL